MLEFKNKKKVVDQKPQQLEETYEMKIEKIEQKKTKGNEYFKKEEYEHALKFYNSAICMLNQIPKKMKKSFNED